jgi:hypothetical protein
MEREREEAKREAERELKDAQAKLEKAKEEAKRKTERELKNTQTELERMKKQNEFLLKQLEEQQQAQTQQNYPSNPGKS